ncbi:MAG: chlororespiratory reduction protein 7 [Leptolyngbyaceae cyanobacterium T60_A2020_046]|nr:chlororespiratory reduction protein 7 [Leptolyngbyaceae cyanobacterium T60_A2020_046]
MTDSLMYEEEMFVLLVPGQEEEILSVAELLDRLKAVLRDRQAELPRDVAKFTTLEDQAQYLLNTACEFLLAPGQTLQWYAIRLEK